MNGLVNTFDTHWSRNLGNVSSDNLKLNWSQNFDAFDSCIERNITGGTAVKFIVPSVTGSGKTQQIIHKAIALKGSQVGTLIVVMRTADADIIAHAIQADTDADYVKVFHKNTLTQSVSLSTQADIDNVQCLVVTHEMFRRNQAKIIDNRDFIVIDEALDAITMTSMTSLDLDNMIKIVDVKKPKKVNAELDRDA